MPIENLILTNNGIYTYNKAIFNGIIQYDKYEHIYLIEYALISEYSSQTGIHAYVYKTT